MGHFVFTDAKVVVNAVDLSDHVESVTLEYKAELQDDTNMGDTTRTRLGGLKDWSVSINFRQDLKVTIQALGWRKERRFYPGQHDICSVAYWYQTLPAQPFPPLPDRNSLENV